MSWQDQLGGDPLAWLLARDSPGVRYLALRDLLDVPGDNSELRAAAQAAHTENPIAAILDRESRVITQNIAQQVFDFLMSKLEL